MPIEICLLRHRKREEEETRQKKKKIAFLCSRERKKKEKEYKTHRHFDASGRLPADFHVEEHDWVGHDDDFDSKKK